MQINDLSQIIPIHWTKVIINIIIYLSAINWSLSSYIPRSYSIVHLGISISFVYFLALFCIFFRILVSSRPELKSLAAGYFECFLKIYLIFGCLFLLVCPCGLFEMGVNELKSSFQVVSIALIQVVSLDCFFQKKDSRNNWNRLGWHFWNLHVLFCHRNDWTFLKFLVNALFDLFFKNY